MNSSPGGAGPAAYDRRQNVRASRERDGPLGQGRPGQKRQR